MSTHRTAEKLSSLPMRDHLSHETWVWVSVHARKLNTWSIWDFRGRDEIDADVSPALIGHFYHWELFSNIKYLVNRIGAFKPSNRTANENLYIQSDQ